MDGGDCGPRAASTVKLTSSNARHAGPRPVKLRKFADLVDDAVPVARRLQRPERIAGMVEAGG